MDRRSALKFIFGLSLAPGTITLSYLNKSNNYQAKHILASHIFPDPPVFWREVGEEMISKYGVQPLVNTIYKELRQLNNIGTIELSAILKNMVLNEVNEQEFITVYGWIITRTEALLCTRKVLLVNNYVS